MEMDNVVTFDLSDGQKVGVLEFAEVLREEMPLEKVRDNMQQTCWVFPGVSSITLQAWVGDWPMDASLKLHVVGEEMVIAPEFSVYGAEDKSWRMPRLIDVLFCRVTDSLYKFLGGGGLQI